ncbi:MAG: serine protease [Pseudonocardia sp.]
MATAAAAVGLVALGVVAAPAAGAAPAGGSGAIHPGVVTESEGGGACTSNFVFTSGGRTFIGQAAHCAGTGTATETDGCDSGSGPLGTVVTILADDGTERVGTLAYSSWLTMQEAGETDENACAFNDFALVEIAEADVADVDPTVPFFGGPDGLDTDGVPVGEEVHSYGNSPLRQGIAALSPKSGVSAGDGGAGWTHEVYTVTPGIPGDSGSAFLDSDGDAIGTLSTLNLAPLPLSNGVSDLAMALDYARANAEGFEDLELVLGTVPFSA